MANVFDDIFSYALNPFQWGAYIDREVYAPQRKEQQKQIEAQERANQQAQNQAVQEQFRRSRQARGLGSGGSIGSGRFISGLSASQTGSVLTSVTNGNQASGL